MGWTVAPRGKLKECTLDKILVHSLEDKNLSGDSCVLIAFLCDWEKMRIQTVLPLRPLHLHLLVHFLDLWLFDSLVIGRLCKQH